MSYSTLKTIESSYFLKEQIITQRDERISQVPIETPLTQKQRHQFVADVIRSVRGKEKTVKSSWVAGSGPILKKKDRVAMSLAQEQSVRPSENDILREQLAEVNQQLAETGRELRETRQQASAKRRAEEELW